MSSSQSRSPTKSLKKSASSARMDGASVNARLKAHAPEKRAGQPERTDAGGDTVITLRMRLQEVTNQYERELKALKQTHAAEMSRAFAIFTSKNNELVKANNTLRLECRKSYDLYKHQQIENQGLKQIIKLHAARVKETGLSSPSSPKSSSTHANTHAAVRSVPSVEASGKGTAGFAGVGENDSRLSNVDVSMLEETGGSSPNRSPKAGSRTHGPKQLETIEEDAQSEGTSAEGDEDTADALHGFAACAHISSPEPIHFDDVSGAVPETFEPQGEVMSPLLHQDNRGQQTDAIARSLVAFCAECEDGRKDAPAPHEAKHPPTTSSSSDADVEMDALLHTSPVRPKGSSRSALVKRDLEDPGTLPDGKRSRRRSSIVTSYAEPKLTTKLRQGCSNTFNSGYDTGIQTFSLAEKQRLNAKRKEQQRRRQSLPVSLSAPVPSP